MFGLALRGLTLTKPKMQGNSGRREYNVSNKWHTSPRFSSSICVVQSTNSNMGDVAPKFFSTLNWKCPG
jgi:hypothetical protein